MDGSGDCSDDLLQLHYPDEDIPQELIGFLDDKVSSASHDHLALAEIFGFILRPQIGIGGKGHLQRPPFLEGGLFCTRHEKSSKKIL